MAEAERNTPDGHGEGRRKDEGSPGGVACAAVVAGVALGLWAWLLDRPPAPLSADAPPEAFSAERALAPLRVVAARPHMPGSAEHARVRGFLVAELEEMGFETEVQEAVVLLPRGRSLQAFTVRNVLGRKRGTANTGGVAIASHYDSQQLPAGAGDDGSGVAATLEALRALAHHEPLRNDLYVVITDAEELGLVGARGFVDRHRWWSEVSVLLSFEARGSAGASVMFETNSENGWVVREFARADPYPIGSSLYYEIYQRLPNDTDFSIFKRAGVTGLNFAIAEGADVYHRTTDTVENLSLASLQHHGEHALAMMRHFGALDLSGATRAPDVVFFPVAGLGLVTYSIEWVAIFAVLALLFTAHVVGRGLRDGGMTIGGIVGGLAVSLGGAGIAAGISLVMWRLVRGAHVELGSIVGRALYDESWYGLAIGAIAVGTIALLHGLARSRFSAASLAAGAAIPTLMLALVTSWYTPGVSMLFLWPTVFAFGGARYLGSRPTGRSMGGGDVAASAILAAPVILTLFPLVWTVYIGLNISVAPIIGALAALMLALTTALFEAATQGNRIALPAGAFGLALAFALIGVWDAAPGPGRPRPDDLVYALDRESGVAQWATMTAGQDGWIERFVGEDAASGDLAPFLAGNPRTYRLAPAPLVDAPPPAASYALTTRDDGRRAVRVEIRSAVGPELINVSPATVGVALTAVNGVAVESDEHGSDDLWLMQHYGEPPGGTLVLELLTDPGDEPFELVVVEFLMRLPPVAGVDTSRPADVVAHGRRLTDVTLLRQVLPID